MSIHRLMRGLAFLSFSSAAIGAASPPADVLSVKAYSDVIAAGTCLERGYPYMVRIGPHDVLCLLSTAGVEKAAVRTRDVIEAAVRSVQAAK